MLTQAIWLHMIKSFLPFASISGQLISSQAATPNNRTTVTGNHGKMNADDRQDDSSGGKKKKNERRQRTRYMRMEVSLKQGGGTVEETCKPAKPRDTTLTLQWFRSKFSPFLILSY